MKRLYLLALCALSVMLPAKAYAQSPDTLALSMQEAVQHAQEQNYQVRTAAAETDATRAGARQALSAFLPQVSVAENATATTDPLNAFGFLLKQETVTQADFAPEALNDPDRIDNYTTQVTIQQPVLNLEGLFARRAATRRAEAAALRTQRTARNVRFQVQTQYYRLVLTRERRSVIAAALQAARSNRDRAEDLLDQGMITQADVLAARVRVLELEADQTEVQAAVKDAADQLRYLLGMDEKTRITPTDDLPDPIETPVQVDVQAVNAERSDMRALRLRRNAAEQRVNAARAAFLPTVNAQGGYEWNDPTPFGTEASGWTVGISLTWNVFGGFRQIGGMQQARANERAAELAVRDQALQNEVEIEAAQRALATSRERIQQTRAVVEQARASYRLRSDRFDQGLESTSDLLQAEAQLAESRLAALQARYAHATNRFRLELLTERPLR
jgi:outer membrane protein TolC